MVSVATGKRKLNDTPVEASFLNPQSPEEEIRDTIVVEDIPPNTPKQMLQMFFEQKKFSGGGDIKELTFDADSGTATIKFASEDGKD